MAIMSGNKNSTFDKLIFASEESVSKPLEERRKRVEKGREFIRKRIIVHLNESGVTDAVILESKDN